MKTYDIALSAMAANCRVALELSKGFGGRRSIVDDTVLAKRFKKVNARNTKVGSPEYNNLLGKLKDLGAEYKHPNPGWKGVNSGAPHFRERTRRRAYQQLLVNKNKAVAAFKKNGKGLAAIAGVAGLGALGVYAMRKRKAKELSLSKGFGGRGSKAGDAADAANWAQVKKTPDSYAVLNKSVRDSYRAGAKYKNPHPLIENDFVRGNLHIDARLKRRAAQKGLQTRLAIANFIKKHGKGMAIAGGVGGLLGAAGAYALSKRKKQAKELSLSKGFGGRRTRDMDIVQNVIQRRSTPTGDHYTMNSLMKNEAKFAGARYKSPRSHGQYVDGIKHIERRAKRRGVQRVLGVKSVAGKAVKKFAGRLASGAGIAGAVGLVGAGAYALGKRAKAKRQAQELSLAFGVLGKVAQMGRIGFKKVKRALPGLQRKVKGVVAPDAIQRVRGAALNRKAQQAATIQKQKAAFAAAGGPAGVTPRRSILQSAKSFASGAGRATIKTAKATFNPKNIGHAAVAATGIGVGAALARPRDTSHIDNPDAPRKGWKVRQ